MNWRISRAVAALFIFSFLVSSCDEDPTSLGLELQGPGTQIGTIFADTATVEASTVLLKDSIITLGAPRVQVGSIENPVFGKTVAKTFVEFGLISENVAFDPNEGADSLVLTLDYDYFYGDTTQTTTWNVYRLTQGFSDQATYFTTTDLTHSEAPIGTVTFTPRPTTTYYTISGTDTTKNLPVLVRIRLDQTTGGLALANEILAQSDKAPLKTQQAFVTNLLKGLVLAPASESEGVILGLNLTSNSSSLKLYYTSTSDTTANKTKSYTFYPTSRYFNQIKGDFTGTPLASLNQNAEALPAEEANGLTYLQSGTGLVTKLTFPHLSDLREDAAGQPRDLAVNKAELVIPIDMTSLPDTALYPLPTVISVVEATSSNRIARANNLPITLPQEGGGQYAFLEYRGKDKGYVYVVNITSYIQNVLYNARPNNGLILLPSDILTNAATPTRNAQTVNRAILQASSQTNPDRSIKLRIFYSVAQ